MCGLYANTSSFYMKEWAPPDLVSWVGGILEPIPCGYWGMTVHSEVDFILPLVVLWVFENFCSPDAQCDLSGAPHVCDSHVPRELVNVSQQLWLWTLRKPWISFHWRKTKTACDLIGQLTKENCHLLVYRLQKKLHLHYSASLYYHFYEKATKWILALLPFILAWKFSYYNVCLNVFWLFFISLL